MGGLALDRGRLSPGKRRQHIDRGTRAQRLSMVPHSDAVAQKRAARQHAGQSLAATAEGVDKLTDGSTGVHDQLLGIGPGSGAGSGEIPDGNPDLAACPPRHLNRRSRSSAAAVARTRGR